MKYIYILYFTSKTENEILCVFASQESAEECIKKFHPPESGTSDRKYHIVKKKIIYSLDENDTKTN